jgi:ribosomal-protein-alanine N-acetyltransferase
MPLPLHTHRLAIRPLTAEDAADVFALYSDARVMEFFHSRPMGDVDVARAWAVTQGGLHASRGYAQWHMSERGGDCFVGCLGLQPLGDGIELLYALVPGMWGRGYAAEAGAAALEYGFDELGLERIVGIAVAANRPSIRVLQRLGMRSLGAAEYWGCSWEKYEVNLSVWRNARQPARLPLVTMRLELRPFVADDLDGLVEIFGDPVVMRFVGAERRPLDRDAVRSSQERVREHWEQHGFGSLAAVERSTRRLVGEAGLQALEGGPDVELTYTLARTAWGRGLATEAARAALAWGFEGLRMERIVAVADPRNRASLRVLEKLGMTLVGPRACYGADLVEYEATAARRSGGLSAPL